MLVPDNVGRVYIYIGGVKYTFYDIEMIRILILITLCSAPSALANLATCTSDNVAAGGWLPQTIFATNDQVFAVAVRTVCHLPGCTCALVLLATIAPTGRPPLAVGYPMMISF